MEHIHDLSAKLQKGDFAYLGGIFGDGLALFCFQQQRRSDSRLLSIEETTDLRLLLEDSRKLIFTLSRVQRQSVRPGGCAL